MPITLAPAALQRIHGYLAADKAASACVSARRTGCSGWGYVVDMDPRPARGRRGVRTGRRAHLIDADSLALVDGTEIDFVKQGLNEQFVFRKPNVAANAAAARVSPPTPTARDPGPSMVAPTGAG